MSERQNNPAPKGRLNFLFTVLGTAVFIGVFCVGMYYYWIKGIDALAEGKVSGTALVQEMPGDTAPNQARHHAVPVERFSP